jgi:hypothetical protein
MRYQGLERIPPLCQFQYQVYAYFKPAKIQSWTQWVDRPVSEHLKTLKSLKSLDIRHLKLLKGFKSLDITWLSLEFKEILWTSTWHIHCHEDHSNQKRNEKNMRIGSSVQFGAISVWFGKVSI